MSTEDRESWGSLIRSWPKPTGAVMVAGIVGVLLLGASLIFGATSPSRDGYSCGSVFAPHNFGVDEFVDSVAPNPLPSGPGATTADKDCGPALSDRRPWVYAGLAFGAVILLGGVSVWFMALPDRDHRET